MHYGGWAVSVRTLPIRTLFLGAELKIAGSAAARGLHQLSTKVLVPAQQLCSRHVMPSSVETPEVRWQSAPMNGVMAIHADAGSHGNLHADARSCGDARHRRGNGNSRRCTEFRQPTPMHGVTAAHTDARSHSNIRADARSHGNIRAMHGVRFIMVGPKPPVVKSVWQSLADLPESQPWGQLPQSSGRKIQKK
ncbi:hypothetical protein C8F04DRAFT_1199011 [Mycena alexandri]|uniref:Uncharacterized protein n=1 Tax=Mycena alexandri TaxID=1745969 RepID=A0AAD6RZY9_9AGAR|nr:hypothetical protein C8F04DRAFT_1199011 [Mycena alexandri]